MTDDKQGLHDARTPILLFLGFLCLRIPFRAHYLINWDSVNFALGTHVFNLQHHQPHPPGYIGYVFLGWLLNHVTGDANTSLTILSIVAGTLAPMAFYLLASIFMPRRYALLSAILFGLSPVVWYYSEVALTYIVEMAIALFFLWLAYTARLKQSSSALFWATVLLVGLGAIRQSGALLLMPVWFYVIWRFPWRTRFLSGATLLVGDLAWLIPLFWLSGGIETYFRLSGQLADLAVMPTSIFSMDPITIGQNVGFVVGGIVIGINLGLAIIALAIVRRRGAPFSLFSRHRMLFFLWLAPALAVYLLLHTGQLGYVLLVLPAGFLLVGQALWDLGTGRQTSSKPSVVRPIPTRFFLRRRLVVATTVLLLAISSTATFVVAPHAAYALATSNDSGIAKRFGLDLFAKLPLFRVNATKDGGALADRARQYDLKMSDEHWQLLTGFVKEFDPSRTIILTTPDGAGSFRPFTYYLPKYQVFGLGRALTGRYGYLFRAYGGTSNYTVAGLSTVSPSLKIPSGVQWLVIPDQDVYHRMQGFNMMVVDLGGDAECAVALLRPGTTLTFSHPSGANVSIVPERGGTSN